MQFAQPITISRCHQLTGCAAPSWCKERRLLVRSTVRQLDAFDRLGAHGQIPRGPEAIHHAGTVSFPILPLCISRGGGASALPLMLGGASGGGGDDDGGGSDQSYIIRGGQRGADRLVVLANATWRTSEPFLRRAGLRAGMQCLDAGCGNGEISRRLMSIIGPTGSLLGVDMDAQKIAIAQKMAAQGHHTNMQFAMHNLMSDPLAQNRRFDFIYLRFLLSHLQQPDVLLARLLSCLHPNGIIAIEDVEFAGHYSQPKSAAFDRYVELYTAAAAQRGADANIGHRLADMVRRAGCRDVEERSITPSFSLGDGKQMALITLEAIGPSVVAAGLATDHEMAGLVADLRQFTNDPATAMSIPTVYQVTARAVL
jgi:ubiquinone/menaquinone biosynthesis C-methylase UbiE